MSESEEWLNQESFTFAPAPLESQEGLDLSYVPATRTLQTNHAPHQYASQPPPVRQTLPQHSLAQQAPTLQGSNGAQQSLWRPPRVLRSRERPSTASQREERSRFFRETTKIPSARPRGRTTNFLRASHFLRAGNSLKARVNLKSVTMSKSI